MKTILIVDDNPDNRYLITYILKNNAFLTIEAVNGTQAVNKALDEQPDLILMDIQLPDMSGLEATQQIKQSTPHRHIPVVALTSYALDGDKDKALKAGCSGYIEKPINPNTIIDQIHQALASC